MWSLRAQADRREYQKMMKHTLELQENLWVKQAEVTGHAHRRRGGSPACAPHTGAVYRVQAAVIVATGHLPGGTHHRGRCGPGLRPGRPGRRPAPDPRACAGLGLVLRRVQDGHAPRVNARSVDFLPDGGPAGGRGCHALLL
ncbi:MAG: FAD-dependent oxidoreductase [Lawsonibacter sp.]